MKYFLYKSDNIYFLVNKLFLKYFLCMKLKPFYLSKLKLPFIKFINTMESIIFYILMKYFLYKSDNIYYYYYFVNKLFFKKNILFA